MKLKPGGLRLASWNPVEKDIIRHIIYDIDDIGTRCVYDDLIWFQVGLLDDLQA